MKAAILLTGDEITKGVVKDSNGGYLSEKLTALGFEVQSIVIVPDRKEFIEKKSVTLWIKPSLANNWRTQAYFRRHNAQTVADFLGKR